MAGTSGCKLDRAYDPPFEGRHAPLGSDSGYLSTLASDPAPFRELRREKDSRRDLLPCLCRAREVDRQHWNAYLFMPSTELIERVSAPSKVSTGFPHA